MGSRPQDTSWGLHIGHSPVTYWKDEVLCQPQLPLPGAKGLKGQVRSCQAGWVQLRRDSPSQGARPSVQGGKPATGADQHLPRRQPRVWWQGGGGRSVHGEPQKEPRILYLAGLPPASYNGWQANGGSKQGG